MCEVVGVQAAQIPGRCGRGSLDAIERAATCNHDGEGGRPREGIERVLFGVSRWRRFVIDADEVNSGEALSWCAHV